MGRRTARLLVFVAAAALAGWAAVPSYARASAQYRSGPSCGQIEVRGDQGVVFRLLFAKNGAVQRFVLEKGSRNPENDHETLVQLQGLYGQEGQFAPPLQIVSFKKGPSGGLMVPDKAIDSCGRVSHF